jgi:hypothetical protein
LLPESTRRQDNRFRVTRWQAYHEDWVCHFHPPPERAVGRHGDAESGRAADRRYELGERSGSHRVGCCRRRRARRAQDPYFVIGDSAQDRITVSEVSRILAGLHVVARSEDITSWLPLQLP